MAAQYGSLPFDEAIRFFRGKELVSTDRWADVWRAEHDVGFMVAGAAKADLLADLHGAILKAVAQGTTLAAFRKDFDAIVARHGWTGWTGEGSPAGRAWRTRLIYETNLRTSYQAGRWAQVQAGQAQRPYLIYRHSDLSTHPRKLHQAWDGLVVAVDDPWVKTHWPPNGWGCKCRMFALAERDLQRIGKTGPDTPPQDGSYEWVDKVTGETHTVPNGIDPGWDYAPGASRTDLMRQSIERKAARLPGGIGQAFKKDMQAVGASSLLQPSARIIQSVTLQKSIQETFSSGDWPLFARGDVQGHRSIAVLPDDIRQWLNVSADGLLLSQQTALKQYREHSDITPDDYRRIQFMLNEGEIRSDRDLHLGLIQEQGKWFYAVIKATKTGLAVFLQSFRRTNPNDLITIRARSALKRAAQ